MLRIDRTRVRILMAKREIKNYTALADRAGIHANTLLNLLNGDEFKSTTAEKLATALDVNPIDLMVTAGFPDPNSVALALN